MSGCADAALSYTKQFRCWCLARRKLLYSWHHRLEKVGYHNHCVRTCAHL